MKRLFLLLIPVLFIWSCSKETSDEQVVELVRFTDTGCDKSALSPATRAGSDTPQLILAYSEEGLIVTRTNAMMNCSINGGGISCDVSCEGSDILYHAYETDGAIMKCQCPVVEMSSVISGLRLGREYTIHYVCSDIHYSPITFTYKKGLALVVDILPLPVG